MFKNVVIINGIELRLTEQNSTRSVENSDPEISETYAKYAIVGTCAYLEIRIVDSVFGFKATTADDFDFDTVMPINQDDFVA